MHITKRMRQWLIAEGHVKSGATVEECRYAIGTLLITGKLKKKEFLELADPFGDEENFLMSKTTSPDPVKVFGNGGDLRIRVKDASDQYSEKRATGLHKRTGQAVIDSVYGGEATLPSEANHARTGALMKHLGRRAGLPVGPQSEHEKALLAELCQQEWAGTMNDEYVKVANPGYVKALIDDATSGGLELTPIHFDQDIVTFPLLSGELFPFVNVQEVPRGRRIESGSLGTPTVAWGQGDNTAVDLFNTASLAAAIDTTIFECAVAIEIGNDFLSDAAVDVGARLTSLIGERLAAELDKMVAIGDGSSQPEGIFAAAGVATVNAGGDAPTLADYQSLWGAVGKQYRQGASFVTNDLTYLRSRQIQIDTANPTTDQRPVLAPVNDIGNYFTLSHPHRVQNDIGNALAAFVNLSKYKMYRRMGMAVHISREGQYLMRRNLSLMVVRARFGGKLRDGGAMAKWTDGLA